MILFGSLQPFAKVFFIATQMVWNQLNSRTMLVQTQPRSFRVFFTPTNWKYLISV